MNKSLAKLCAEIERLVAFDAKEEAEKAIILKFLRENPDALQRENRLAHLTTSAWIVNPKRTKVLMVYHTIYDSWSWTGGHADGEADLYKVVQKEVREETGIKGLKLLSDGIYGVAILPVDAHTRRGEFVNAHVHVDVEFLFEADETEELRPKEDENSGVKWVAVDEIAKIVAEKEMLPVYERMNAKLVKLEKNMV